MKIYARTYHKQGNHLTSVHNSIEEAKRFCRNEREMWTEDRMKIIGAMISEDKNELLDTETFKYELMGKL